MTTPSKQIQIQYNCVKRWHICAFKRKKQENDVIFRKVHGQTHDLSIKSEHEK
jgi:hypothetical protein